MNGLTGSSQLSQMPTLLHFLQGQLMVHNIGRSGHLVGFKDFVFGIWVVNHHAHDIRTSVDLSKSSSTSYIRAIVLNVLRAEYVSRVVIHHWSLTLCQAYLTCFTSLLLFDVEMTNTSTPLSNLKIGQSRVYKAYCVKSVLVSWTSMDFLRLTSSS